MWIITSEYKDPCKPISFIHVLWEYCCMEGDIITPFKVMNYAIYDVENPPEEFGNLSSWG